MSGRMGSETHWWAQLVIDRARCLPGSGHGQLRVRYGDVDQEPPHGRTAPPQKNSWRTDCEGVDVTDVGKAVFLSYASQDAEAAKRICDALRAAGIEVWFDQSELRGGDVWDRQIRQQIHDCRLFMPIVSTNTEAREEGYFRREWKLAVDRTHDLSERATFLVPIAIDSIAEAKADVPDAFRHIQWTRLPEGLASSAFIERIQRLLMPEPSSAPRTGTAPAEYRIAKLPTTTNGPHRVAMVALWIA